MEHAQQIKAFILSAIRQRRKLMKQGKSRKNRLLMLKNIEHLERYMEVYPYTNNVQMAKYFLRNEEKIQSLLPGIKSRDYNARQQQFNQARQLSNQIINPQVAWTQQKLSMSN